MWNIGPSHSIPLWNSYIKADKKKQHTIGASGPGGYGPAGGPFHCGG